MNIMFLLLGVSLVVALIFLVIFIVTVRSGQYDDMYTPSVRMLFEDGTSKTKSATDNNKSKTKKNN
ncbi:MAG TPA: cbb3-type cytochrome oxidase assembly protein CcoS [Flavobacteriaceae bacterium]|nr:cbb3-type cytochrome oxidase assembly protein CcoS [Flavobacteriaceae bacterium]